MFARLLLDKTKPKRRGDVTPEKSMTPVPSVVGVSDEGQSNQPVASVLSKEDIQSLAINVDDLKKVNIARSSDIV